MAQSLSSDAVLPAAGSPRLVVAELAAGGRWRLLDRQLWFASADCSDYADRAVAWGATILTDVLLIGGLVVQKTLLVA